MTATLTYTPYGAVDALFEPLKAYARGDVDGMIRSGREWKETLCAGAAGTGKSRGVAQYVDALCTLFPGIRVLVCRQTLKSLRESVQVTLEDKVWAGNHPCLRNSTASRQHRSGYTYPEETNVVGGGVYRGRSEIVLGGLDKPGRTFSTEYDIVWVEEAFEISLDAWESLLRTNRNGVMPWQQMIATTNPDGEFHWLNQRPEEKDAHGKPKMRRLVSRHWENPVYWDLEQGTWTEEGREYVCGALEHLSGPRRRRLLKGEWVSAEGLIWDSYDKDVHVIPRADLPRFKYAVGGLDWGFRNPGALTVWGVDGDDRLYCVFEAYHTGKTLDWWAEMVQLANKRLQDEHDVEMVYVVADSAEPRSIQSLNHILRKPQYEGSGYVRPAEHKDQLAQIMLVDRAMRADLPLNGGRPAFFIAKDTLLHSPDVALQQAHRPTSLKREIPAWVWRKTEDGRPIKDEEDPTCDAHACDTTRYVFDAVLGRDYGEVIPRPTYKPGSMGDVLGHDDDDLHLDP